MKTLSIIITAALISGTAYGQVPTLDDRIDKLQTTLEEIQDLLKAQLIYLKLQKKFNFNDPKTGVDIFIDNQVDLYDLQEASRLGHLSGLHN